MNVYDGLDDRGFFRFQRHGLIETVSVSTHLRHKGPVVARGDHSEIVGASGQQQRLSSLTASRGPEWSDPEHGQVHNRSGR